MTVETVRQRIRHWRDYFTEFVSDRVTTGYEDALAAVEEELGGYRIIRGICKTCGGLGQVPSEELDGHIAMQVGEPCPDCPPVTVLEPAAWEAFVCSVICMEVAAFAELEPQPKTRAQAQECFDNWIAEFVARPTFDDWWMSMEADAHTLLQALLPGARVATEVVVGARGILDEDGAASRFYVAEDSEEPSVCDIALLADTREEAEE